MTFSILDEERDLIAGKRDATRLGFAILLKFYTQRGRFPRGRSELPDDVVEHVAKQVRVPASEFGFYEWSGSTIEYHRHQIRTHLGFRTCTTEDATKLAVWLAERAKKGEARQLLMDVILPVLNDPGIPDEQVGGLLRTQIGLEKLREVASVSWKPLPRDHGRLSALEASYTYLRQFTPHVLNVIDFQGGPREAVAAPAPTWHARITTPTRGVRIYCGKTGGSRTMSASAAEVIPLGRDEPETFASAVEAYLRSAGIGASSKRVYKISLTTWAWLARGEQAPLGTDRRGAVPPAVAFADLEAPGAIEAITAAFVERARLVDPNTVNRELSVMKAAVAWWRGRGWLTASPIAGIERRPAPPDRTRALSRDQIADLFALKVPLREKALWRMLYETCARAEEILTLDVDDLLPDDERGKVVSKGGATDWVHWQSGTAQLLPRLVKGRLRGPVFLTTRKAPARTPTKDKCRTTERARLSYRRGAELFEFHTRALANPGVTDPDELELLGGWTLHQLRHSALTHEAEDGTNTPTLLARSRHASVRSLERYARPGVDAVADHVASRDPAARRKHR